jgi:uncharacterized protein YdaU (DUF1376 family)
MAAAHDNNWMPLYIGDYLRDTARLTVAEHGAYLLLIMDYWVNGPPPDDDAKLAAIVRATPTTWRRKLRPTIELFFQKTDGFWRQKRIDFERARAHELNEQKRKAGQASAAARRARDGTAQPEHPLNSVRDSVRTQAQPQRTEDSFKKTKGDLGFASGATDEPAPDPPASDELVPMDELVDAIRGNLRVERTGIYDPLAYRRSVVVNKRDRWLNNLATFVGAALDGDARMAAWEAIEVRRSCGSGADTPPEVRRAVDQLSRLREQLQHAEAAE